MQGRKRRTFYGRLSIVSIAWGVAVGSVVVNRVTAQPILTTPPLAQQGFETDTGRWVVIGEESKISLTHEPANVKVGKGALQFDYPLRTGQVAGLAIPTPNGLPLQNKSFRFWIKADYATTLVLLFQELNGGRYIAPFHAPKDTWQRVELEPADFMLAEDDGDPQDPNHKLDLDKLQGVGIMDLNLMLIQDVRLASFLGIQPGQHTLYLDDISASPEALPALPAPPDGTLDLDALLRPHLSWISAGEMSLRRVQDKGLTGPALQMEYRQTQNKVSGVMKIIQPGKLKGMGQLTFDVASLKPATLVVQVEEKGDGKYNAVIEVPGNTEPKRSSLRFADMKPADDSKDGNNRLDPEQIKLILFLDATGLLGGGTANNTLLLNNLRAERAQ